MRDGAASTAASETFGVGDGATSAAGLGGLCSIMVFSDDQRNCLQIMLDFHEFLFGIINRWLIVLFGNVPSEGCKYRVGHCVHKYSFHSFSC